MKKRVLMVDPLSYIGHVNYNYGLFRAISSYYKVEVIVNTYSSKSLINKGVPERDFVYIYPDGWNIVSLSKRMHKLFYHVAFRFFFIKVLLKVKNLEKYYDDIILTCIDIYALVLISWIFKKKFYVVDHDIGNVESRKLYRWAWKLVNKKANLIVLEEYIKKMAAERLKRSVWVARHPLPILRNNVKGTKCINKEDNGIFLYAPSASNDSGFLKGLCSEEIPSYIKIVARSTHFEYQNNNLNIYNRFISKEEYNNMLMESDFVILPYPSTYNYRTSAVLYEALVIGKPVMILNNNTLSNYHTIFKNSVYLFKSYSDLFEKAASLVHQKHVVCLDDYSDECLSRCIKEMIG